MSAQHEDWCRYWNDGHCTCGNSEVERLREFCDELAAALRALIPFVPLNSDRTIAPLQAVEGARRTLARYEKAKKP